MEKEELHLTLVAALRDRLALEHTEITHVIGVPLLSQPPVVAGHQPDLLGRSLGKTLVIGLAKLGPDLFDESSLAQYRAFANHQDLQSAERASLVVVVLREFKEKAGVAIRQAGIDDDRFFVQGVRLPSE